jgi:RES domain-containing protein
LPESTDPLPSLWRISNYPSLSGEGGLHYSARWHTAGQPIVYLAESPAGALVEVLVHLELDERDWPRSYNLIQVDAPDKLKIETLDPSGARNWKTNLAVTRQLGDAWLRSGRTALARVPSVILPDTWNVLLNPRHPAAAQVRIVRTVKADYDLRFFPKPRKPKQA